MSDQALLVEYGPNARLRQYLIENRIVAVNDGFRRIDRGKNAIPQIDVEIGYAKFGQRCRKGGSRLRHRHGKRTASPIEAADPQDKSPSPTPNGSPTRSSGSSQSFWRRSSTVRSRRRARYGSHSSRASEKTYELGTRRPKLRHRDWHHILRGGWLYLAIQFFASLL